MASSATLRPWKAAGWASPPRPVGLFGRQLEDRDRHVRQVVLPDDYEVAAPDVMTVAQEIRCPELRFREDPAPSLLQDVIRKRHAALENAEPEALRPLGEDLPKVQFVLRHEADGVAAIALAPFSMVLLPRPVSEGGGSLFRTA